jgi:hypothetical protein
MSLSHFTITIAVVHALLDRLDLGRGQLERRVDTVVEISFQPHDFRGDLIVPIAALGTARLPRVAFFQGMS